MKITGTTLLVRRQSPATVFAAVHEPFEHNTLRLAAVRRVAQTQEGLAVAVEGKAGTGVNDRLLYAVWGVHTMPLTLEGGGESFTFADRAFIRISKDQVEASGDLSRLRLPVSGTPRLVINGALCPSAFSDGCLVYHK
jgi:hypothetical protein